MEKRQMITVMVTLGACAVLVLALLGAFALGRDQAAATAEPAGGGAVRTVSSAGTGSATGRPDVMRFTVGVDVSRADVGGAVDASNALMKQVLKSVRQFDVADKDIRTTRYAIEPRYDYSGNVERLVGYAVTQRARVTLRDLDKAGRALTAIAKAGGNEVRVDGIAFEVSEPTELLDAARADAVAKARASAEIYAKAAGAELGEVIDVREATPSQRNDAEAFDLSAQAARAVPIEAGESELTVRVKVSWSLK